MPVLGRIVAALALSLGCDQMPIVVDYGYEETYTTTITRAVGPTTLSGARGTLPQPTPTNLNAIFLATNGSDAGADGNASTGILAAPVLTLAKAFAVMTAQPTRTTIVIIRNGAVGDLSFSIVSNYAFNANNLQVENGEVAYIVATATRSLTFTTGKVNGINFVSETGTFRVLVQGTGSIDNCYAYSYRSTDGQSNGSARFRFDGTAGTGGSINYSIGFVEFEGGPGTTVTLNNSIILNNRGPSNQGADGNVCMLFQISSASSGTATVNLNRCYLLGSGVPVPNSALDAYPIRIEMAGAGTYTLDLNFTSCFLTTDSSGLYITNISVANKTVDVTYDHTLNATTDVTIQNGSVAPTFNRTTTNEIPASTQPLLIDQFAAQNAQVIDANNARLQIRGKVPPSGSGIYFISSPLEDAGLSGVDVNPWDETTTGPVRAYTKQMTLNTEPKTIQLPDVYVGGVEVPDLNGGTDSDYDGVQRRWSLSWDAQNMVTQIVVKQLKALQRDRGSQRWFMAGLAGELFENIATSAALVATSSVRATLTLVTPNVDLVENNWANWSILVNGEYYWIESNDNADELVIVDTLGVGLPADATYDISVKYILGNLSLDPITAVQNQYQAGMANGSTYAEIEAGELTLPWTGGSVTLIEQNFPKVGRV